MHPRPILFSAPMVRAILAGTKTQTRRVCRHQRDAVWVENGRMYGYNDAGNDGEVTPYAEPGDTLWVRETWRIPGDSSSGKASDSCCTGPSDCDFAADFSGFDFDVRRPWRPSIFMPRWASRLSLRVTGVRVERLQEISEADAQAEGITDSWPEIECNSDRPFRDGFRWLWDRINGNRAAWDSNPWVWVVQFKRV